MISFSFDFIYKISFTDMIGLFQISIAFCVAYLGLDRFRYAKRANRAFKDTIENTEYWVNNFANDKTCGQPDEDDQEKKSSERDAALTELKMDYNKTCDMGIGPKWCRQYLSCDYRGGNDCKLVIAITFILIILLIIATLFPASKTLLFSCPSLVFSILGIILPCYLIHSGNRDLAQIEDYLAKKLHNVRLTYDSGYRKKLDSYKILIEENANKARQM